MSACNAVLLLLNPRWHACLDVAFSLQREKDVEFVFFLFLRVFAQAAHLTLTVRSTVNVVLSLKHVSVLYLEVDTTSNWKKDIPINIYWRKERISRDIDELIEQSDSRSLSLTLALFHRWNKRTNELLLLHNIVKEIIIVAPCSTLPAWHTFCLFFPLLLWFQSFFLLRCDDVFFPSLLLEVSLVWFHFSVRSDRHMYVRSSYAQTNKMVYSQETRIPDCV